MTSHSRLSSLKPTPLIAFNALVGLSIAVLTSFQLETVVGPSEMLLMAQAVIGLSVLVLAMPVLLLSEMLVAAVVVKPFKKRFGR